MSPDAKMSACGVFCLAGSRESTQGLGVSRGILEGNHQRIADHQGSFPHSLLSISKCLFLLVWGWGLELPTLAKIAQRLVLRRPFVLGGLKGKTQRSRGASPFPIIYFCKKDGCNDWGKRTTGIYTRTWSTIAQLLQAGAFFGSKLLSLRRDGETADERGGMGAQSTWVFKLLSK